MAVQRRIPHAKRTENPESWMEQSASLGFRMEIPVEEQLRQTSVKENNAVVNKRRAR